MVDVTIDGNKVAFPTNWDDLTLGQYLQLRKWKKDPCGLFAIMTGLDRDLFYKARQVDLDYKLLPLCNFISDSYPLNEAKMPKSITISGKTLDIPTDISLKSFGQKIDFQHYFTEAYAKKKEEAKGTEVSDETLMNETMFDVFAISLAIYFVEDVTGEEYSDERAEKFLPVVLALPVMQVYPIGGFFLRSYFDLLSTSEMSLKQITRRTRLALESKSSRRLRPSLWLTRLLLAMLERMIKSTEYRTRSRSGSSATIKR